MKTLDYELNKEVLRFARRMQHVPRSGIREILGASNGKHIISFGGGVPHQQCIPSGTINHALELVLSKYGAAAFTYGATEGEMELRSYIAETWLPRIGIKASPSEILIVNGSQQALDLLGKIFIDTGSNLLVERPAYLAALQAFSVFEPQIHEVELDCDGPCCDLMRLELLKRKYRFFYSCPTFQNPTGICYSEKRRMEVVDLLNRNNVLLIEDDPYSQLFYESVPPKPVCTFGVQNGIYLGTFSKIIAPGFRLGWIWAKPEIMKHLITVKQASDLCTGRFQQLLLYETLLKMDWNKHLPANRSFYKKQRELFQAYMSHYLLGKLNWKKPEGGMFFWADTPMGASVTLLKRCLEKGVAFADGAAFFASGGVDNFLRLNFTQVSELQMDQGLRIISEQIEY